MYYYVVVVSRTLGFIILVLLVTSFHSTHLLKGF